MVWQGRVQDGVVVLPKGLNLPEGTLVRIDSDISVPIAAEADLESLRAKLLALAGTASLTLRKVGPNADEPRLAR